MSHKERTRQDAPRSKDRRDKEKRQKSAESLVVLDNPDDGELFETGDAADFAGEQRKKKSKTRF